MVSLLPCEITSSNLVAKREDLSDLPFSPFSLAQDIKIPRANIWGKQAAQNTHQEVSPSVKQDTNMSRRRPLIQNISPAPPNDTSSGSMDD